MRTTIRLAVLALALLAAPHARADVKLGYCDFQRAITEVEEGKAAKAALKKDFDEKQKQLNAKSDEVKRLQDDFQKQAALLTPEAKNTKGEEIQRKMAEAQDFYMRLQQDLSGKEREAMRPLADKMTSVVKEIAESEGFFMIFDKDSAGLIYAPPAADLTNEVIRKYNARFAAKKAEAPAAPKK